MSQPPHVACPALPAKRPGRLRPALLGEVGRTALLAMPLALGLGMAHPGQAVAQGVTLSGTYTTTQNLTGFSTTTNPLTVASGGTISVRAVYGIYGNGSGAWTILNAGMVQSAGSSAILLRSGGTVANQGTIQANGSFGAGIFLRSGGTVANLGTGAIIRDV